ncbi:aspartate aminotransferase, cytoplasmic [Bradysia coprophila]|uniref:aspartate aminotransferase, cytoplasmic n=1 Tax=Bradysia coprophila TaxID=38358 RepID=UPI00187DD317|nr:aspartate aminotransferase, cytoplasmic [Bradysia coprophila]
MSSSVFANLEEGAKIEVFALTATYNSDPFKDKVNLSVGAYRTADGKPWVLPVVRATETKVATDSTLNHEYIPVTGLEAFTKASTLLLLGEESKAIKENRAVGVQSLSGTGALKIGAEFLARKLGRSVVYFSDPTWENHFKVFAGAGFTTIKEYRYWDPVSRAINFAGLLEDLNNAPENAVIVLHACAHNPTGCDPTEEQWKQIADLMEKKKLFPFFDSAYQGFASGDPIRDAFAVRYFESRGFELLCAQSYAKNFGLYSERIGNLVVVQKDSSTSAAVLSQLTLIVRATYSTPPAYGARVVSTILSNPDLREEWMNCIRMMSSRIQQMRQALFGELTKLKTPGTWNHIVDQIGMFSYTGLNEQQVKLLINEYHIYLLSTGRINMCGLNENNVVYVAQAIHKAVTTINSKI